MNNNQKHFLKSDLIAGLVVFFVAVPLCLGIAMGSGVPLFSGIISGIVGGIVVGFLSKSQVSVSGPAAGLIAIVLAGVTKLGYEGFFLAVFLAGFIQLALYFIKAGGIAYFFPSNVIKGMLSAIGVIIIIKQIPYFIGYDKTFNGSLLFWENNNSSLLESLNFIHLGVAIAGILSLMVMILWDKYKPNHLKVIPGAILAVIVGLVVNEIFKGLNISYLIIHSNPDPKLSQLVSLPIINDFNSLKSSLIFPNFNQIVNIEVWNVAITIGLVASIETLLTIEATDKIDPLKRVTPTNRELLAQGTGNIISGFLGGLPITSVIVRSSANINSGGRTKTSTIFHGILLLIGAIIFSKLLNYIPLTSLAAILLVTGYKLANPAIFKQAFKKSHFEWIPFIVTIIAIVFTDLLKGIAIGTTTSILFLLINNFKNTYFIKNEIINNDNFIVIRLAQEISFLNKVGVKVVLNNIKENSNVIIDASKTVYVDPDVIEIIQDFCTTQSKQKNIKVLLKGFKNEYGIINTHENDFKNI